MNKRGVITIKIIMLLSAIFIIFSILLMSMQRGFSRNNNLRNAKVSAESLMAKYDTYLYINYGLYGMKSRPVMGYLLHDLYDHKSFPLIYSEPLSEYMIIKNQIDSYMKYRLPVNYLEQVLNKLEIINKAKSSQDVMDKKSVVDIALADLSKRLDQRVTLSLKTNELISCVSDYIDELQAIDHRVCVLQKSYDEAEGLDKLAVRSKLSKTLSSYGTIINHLMNYKNYNHELFQILIKSAEETASLEVLIEETTAAILADESALDIVKKQLIESLKASKSMLNDSSKKTVSSKFDAFMMESYPEIRASWYGLLEVPYMNEHLLNELLDFSMPTLTEVADGCLLPSLDFSLLSSYKKMTVLEPRATLKENVKYYKQQKRNTRDSFEYHTEGNHIERKLKYQIDEAADFWSMIGVTPLIENLKVNEYILSTFKSAAASSQTDYDYFSKYKRSSYFKAGEIEYILMGGKYESINIAETVGIIYGVRVVMNGIHVYTDKEKLALSNTIALGVAGWTGYGVPLVSNVIRLGWAMGESIYDMTSLMKGELVPFFKFYPNQWKLDLGLVYKEKQIPNYFDLVAFSYHDYLRLMLLTVSTETKVKRLINLIDLNCFTKYGEFILSDRYNKITVDGYEASYE